MNAGQACLQGVNYMNDATIGMCTRCLGVVLACNLPHTWTVVVIMGVRLTTSMQEVLILAF
jgi:hypothetical protein